MDQLAKATTPLGAWEALGQMTERCRDYFDARRTTILESRDTIHETLRKLFEKDPVSERVLSPIFDRLSATADICFAIPNIWLSAEHRYVVVPTDHFCAQGIDLTKGTLQDAIGWLADRGKEKGSSDYEVQLVTEAIAQARTEGGSGAGSIVVMDGEPGAEEGRGIDLSLPLGTMVSGLRIRARSEIEAALDRVRETNQGNEPNPMTAAERAIVSSFGKLGVPAERIRANGKGILNNLLVLRMAGPRWKYFSYFPARIPGLGRSGGLLVFAAVPLGKDDQSLVMAATTVFYGDLAAFVSERLARQAAQVEEMEARSHAVSSFTHQVGHILAEKSGLPSLLGFAGILSRSPDALPLCGNSPDEVRFRAVQIRYASILPQVFAYCISIPKPDKQRDAMWGAAGHYADVVQGVWDNLVLPLAAYACSRSNNKFGASGRELRLAWSEKPALLSPVPANELVRATLFEIFWNAIRHGDFSSEPQGRATVSIRAHLQGARVRLQIQNPATPGPMPGDDHLKHLRIFVRNLASWSHAKGADQFHIEFENLDAAWQVTFDLPVGP